MSGGNPSGRGGRPNQSLGLPRPYKEGDNENQEKLEPPKKRIKKDKMNNHNGGNNGIFSSSSSSDTETTNGINGEHKKEKRKMNKRDQENGHQLLKIKMIINTIGTNKTLGTKYKKRK